MQRETTSVPSHATMTMKGHAKLAFQQNLHHTHVITLGNVAAENLPDLSVERSVESGQQSDISANLGISTEVAMHQETSLINNRRASFVTWQYENLRPKAPCIEGGLFATGKT